MLRECGCRLMRFLSVGSAVSNFCSTAESAEGAEINAMNEFHRRDSAVSAGSAVLLFTAESARSREKRGGDPPLH